MKLDEIPKIDPFSAPDGYFESLPLRIQTRITKKPKPTSLFIPGLKWATAVAAMVVVLFWFFQPGSPQNAEGLLAEVSTSDLISYLDETDITTEELIQVISEAEADEITNSVYEISITNDDLKNIDLEALGL